MSYTNTTESPSQRKSRADRRRVSLQSIIKGSLRTRRRLPRRCDDNNIYLTDWHDPMLLYLCMGILLLSTADAIMTLNLLQLGAVEINPFMNHLISSDIELFAAGKIGLTAGGLMLLVIRADHRLFSSFTAGSILHLLFPAYLLLIVYEAGMLFSFT